MQGYGSEPLRPFQCRACTWVWVSHVHKCTKSLAQGCGSCAPALARFTQYRTSTTLIRKGKCQRCIINMVHVRRIGLDSGPSLILPRFRDLSFLLPRFLSFALAVSVAGLLFLKQTCSILRQLSKPVYCSWKSQTSSLWGKQHRA